MPTSAGSPSGSGVWGADMKHTRPEVLLHRELLCYVRDSRPTVEEFIARYGGDHDQGFHVLRKCGAIVVDAGRIRLSRLHLSPNGLRFVWGYYVYPLDRDERWHVYYGPGGRPPVFGPEA